MIKLTGNNLGERQRELNTKVKEAAAQLVNFNEIKDMAEESDVDKLFKIDLASEYHNIEYIVEVLKSGDSLYISRALKCSWIYGDSYSHIINVNNLHNNVIPFMSNKMKKKLLTAISIHIRSESRAAEFYKYCRDIRLETIALKFLNFTNDTFKLEALMDKSNCGLLYYLEYGSECLKHYIGVSFTVAEACVKAIYKTKRLIMLQELSYLYTVSEEKYLDLLEKYVEVTSFSSTFLGLRTSKSIMKHHKDRVLKMPSLYVGILSKASIAKYSTEKDAKIYIPAVMPDNVEDFWYRQFCSRYKFLLDKITDGKFEFVKQIFTSRFPGEAFETATHFHQRQCYTFLMTIEEIEIWALEQLANDSDILGIGKEYLWYEFVSFSKAFKEVKKLILITTDYTKRADMMHTLIQSAKTQSDARKLLQYYYEKHGNEHYNTKVKFVDSLLELFNVFQFDEDSWMALNKMFHNLEVYSVADFNNSNSKYRIIALVYYTINQREVPPVIIKQLNCELSFYELDKNTDKLTKEQKEMVFEYLFKFYTDKIRTLASKPYLDEVKQSLRKYIYFTLDVLDHFNKTKEDIPELVFGYMKLDWAEFERHKVIRDKSKTEITGLDLFRDLKNDAKLLVEHLPLVKIQINNTYKFDMNTVVKKLKTYFSNDIAKEYVNFFESLLADDEIWSKVTEAAAHGIFQLGDEKFKVDFMTKYAPKEAPIDHSEIDEKLLRIQRAICAHAFYSRPPVPLKTMLLYIKRDYVHYCLPMFNSYLANLPLPVCVEFVESILDSPVSIQKHGLRLAFECFDAESLNTIVLRAWKKNKSVSLRAIIYKEMRNKVCEVTTGQDILFNTLKQLILTLRPEDDDEIFKLLRCVKIPDHLMADYIETAWKVVSQFPPKSTNLTRMKNILLSMCQKIDIIRHEFVCDIIESFIATVFVQGENEIKHNTEAAALIDVKWQLAATYILNVKGNEDLGKKIELTNLILEKCLKDIAIRDRGALLRSCFNFIHELESRSYDQDFHHYENVNKIMLLILGTLEELLPIEDIYIKVWEIRLGIAARQVIAQSKIKYSAQERTNSMKDIGNSFAKELGILMKEFVEKKLYFGTFSGDINNQVLSKIESVWMSIHPTAPISTCITDMQINVCLGLMSFELPQVYLLVLNLLPDRGRSQYKKEINTIIEKLSKIDDIEFRCNLCKKLSNDSI